MNKVMFYMIVFFSLLGLPMLATNTTYAAVDVFKQCSNVAGSNAYKTHVCQDVNKQRIDNTNPIIVTLKATLNILSLIAGVAAVVLLIVNGLRLIVSNGDSNGVKSARTGIIYVLVGVAVVLIAQTIVIFILNKL